MGDFGQRGVCPVCERTIGLVCGNIRFHTVDGYKCDGTLKEPKKVARGDDKPNRRKAS